MLVLPSHDTVMYGDIVFTVSHRSHNHIQVVEVRFISMQSSTSNSEEMEPGTSVSQYNGDPNYYIWTYLYRNVCHDMSPTGGSC